MQPNTPEDEDTCASGRLSGRGAAAGVSIRLFMNMNYLSFLLLPSPAPRAEEEIDREEDIAGASHPPFTQATAKSQQGLIALSRSSWHG